MARRTKRRRPRTGLAKRRAAGKKAARTRARNKAARSLAAKKGARTRKRRNPSNPKRNPRKRAPHLRRAKRSGKFTSSKRRGTRLRPIKRYKRKTRKGRPTKSRKKRYRYVGWRNPRRRKPTRRRSTRRRRNPGIMGTFKRIKTRLTSPAQLKKLGFVGLGTLVGRFGGSFLSARIASYAGGTFAPGTMARKVLDAVVSFSVGIAAAGLIKNQADSEAVIMGAGASAIVPLVDAAVIGAIGPGKAAEYFGISGMGAWISVPQAGNLGMGGYISVPQASRLGVAGYTHQPGMQNAYTM